MAVALTYPLPLADFFQGLKIETYGWDLIESMRQSQTAGGETLTSDTAVRLWECEVSVTADTHKAMRREPLARALRQGGRSFMLYDPKSAFPAEDPDGSTLGGASVTIDSIDADNKRLTLDGLPFGYTLTRGDMLSFAYGSPARYALHEVVTDSVTVLANPGPSPLFEVQPFIQPGAAVGAAVTLIRPACKAVLVPGSFRRGSRGPVLREGFSFVARQTLR